ncbi:MAG: hypothetical protein GX195_04840 [Firmicutes bacterium]|nr:hypothetical protein [Bacillota bacterium]
MDVDKPIKRRVATGELRPAFAWLPEIPLHRLFSLHVLPSAVAGKSYTFLWEYSGSVGSFLAVVALFILCSWLFERYVEAN